MIFQNILVVPKYVDLEGYLDGDTSIDEVKKKLEDMHQDAEGMIREYNNHHQTMEKVSKNLKKHGPYGLKYSIAYPESLKHIDFKEYDLIMPVGGDGTLIQPVHYCYNQMFFGVNSNPKKGNRRGSIGHWLSTDMDNFEEDFDKIMNHDYYVKRIPRLEAIISNDQAHRGIALNEVAIKKFGFKSAKYIIIANGKEEYQQSSSLVIALKEGATGWLNNIKESQPYTGHENEIQWINESPSNSGMNYSMNQGFAESLRIISEDENNVVTLDSDEETFCYPFKRGQYVDIRISAYPLHIIYADKS